MPWRATSSVQNLNGGLFAQRKAMAFAAVAEP